MSLFKKLVTPKILLLGVVLLLASFFRLYNLKGSLQFQGDQGRDAILVSQIFTQADPVFIGPVTSVGNMYLGPLYYYFMMPFLWLTYPSPMGPVYAVAILGIITVWLTFKLGKELVGEKAALIATIFMAFSATVVTYTRFSWNPNPAPLVSLLMIYFTFKAWKKHPKYWLLVAVFFSILIQLHYLTVLALAGAGVIWLTDFWQRFKNHRSTRKLWQYTLGGLVIFLFSLTPLVLFDYKHQWLNAKAFRALLTNEANFKHSSRMSLPTKIWQTVKETEGRAMHILFEYNLGQQRELNQALTWFVLISLVILATKHRLPGLKAKKHPQVAGVGVLAAYLIVGIIGTASYEHTIFDHYIAYLFPVTALVYGVVLARMTRSMLGKLLMAGFLLFFLDFNIPKMPIKTLGWTVDDIQRTSQTILERVKPGEKYNIVLLSESRDLEGQNYRYFLTTGDKPPVPKESRGEVESLFIIDEEKKTQSVTELPIYEVVTFPKKQPVEVYQISDNGPVIYVLRKN